MPTCFICNHQSEFFCKKDSFDYYLCKNCKTLFVSPQPTLGQINETYKDINYQIGKESETRIRIRGKITLNKLCEYMPHGKTLLDIGSGYGFLLDEAEKLNLKATGIEPSQVLTALPLNIQKHVLNLSLVDFVKQSYEQFDFITLVHVIEHVPNPKLFLTQCLSLLKTNGILYIETPNLDSHLFYAEKDKYTFLTPPEHLFLLSSLSFNVLFKSMNSQIIHTNTYSYGEHFAGIVKNKLGFKHYSNNQKTTPTPHELEKNHIINNNILLSNLKFFLFDRIIAGGFYPLLNVNNKGSILELYIKKLN